MAAAAPEDDAFRMVRIAKERIVSGRGYPICIRMYMLDFWPQPDFLNWQPRSAKGCTFRYHATFFGAGTTAFDVAGTSPSASVFKPSTSVTSTRPSGLPFLS